MNYRTPITDADLHAYVDGELEPDRRREVEAYLREHPEAAAEVEEHRRLNQALDTLYSPVLDEPVPAALAVRPRPHRLWRVAAAAAWLMAGGGLGWFLHPAGPVTNGYLNALSQDLAQPAAFAHYVYAAEALHPVEVPAQQEQHLVTWLSKRLRTDIKVPDLSSQGFTLVGGRLLPSTDRMAAQFMYQRADGTRITLYSRHGAWDNELTAFRYAERDGVRVFYWIDGHLGYALAGELSKEELLALSESIYRQLN